MPDHAAYTINVRPGAGMILTALSSFFVNSSTAFCSLPFYTSLSRPAFLKISSIGHVRSGGQVTLPQNIFAIALWLQFLKDHHENFRSWEGHQYMQNVYLRILISVT